MSKLSLLIVDDEPPARERVRALLGDHPLVEIGGECGEGLAALEMIRRDRPDIVLLDIQMPGRNGLQVVEELPPVERPAIVFVTGHDRYAVEAFAAQAVDYVLKPFDRDRLQLALTRAIGFIQLRRESSLNARVENLLLTLAKPARERVAFKSEGRILLLRPGEIAWVEAAKNNSQMHLVDGRVVTVRETLSAMEGRLAAGGFVRINRSTLVGVDQVKELQYTENGEQRVVLQDNVSLPLSRVFRGALGGFLGS